MKPKSATTAGCALLLSALSFALPAGARAPQAQPSAMRTADAGVPAARRDHGRRELHFTMSAHANTVCAVDAELPYLMSCVRDGD